MKKLLAILVAFCTIFSVSGCNFTIDFEGPSVSESFGEVSTEIAEDTEEVDVDVDVDIDADVADAVEETEGTQTNKEFSLGTILGETYRNDFAGLSFDLPDGWRFYTDDEIKQLNNITSDLVGEEYKALLQSSDIFYDMMACSADQLNNVNVNFEKTTALTKNLSPKDVYEGSEATMKDAMMSMGATSVECEISTAIFGGKEVDALYVTSDFSNVTLEQVCVTVKLDDYFVNIAATAVDKESLQDILSAFSMN